MDLTGLVSLERGVLIVDHDGADTGQLDLVGLIIRVVLNHQNVGADLIFGQLEGAVAHEGLGLFLPTIALIHTLLLDRAENVSGDTVQEEGGGVLQHDLEGIVIQSSCHHAVSSTGAGEELRRAHHVVGHTGSRGRRHLRIAHALPGILKVVCGHRRTIGPVRLSQMERIGQAIIGNIPGFCNTGFDAALDLSGQALEHTDGQILGKGLVAKGGIPGLRFSANVPYQILRGVAFALIIGFIVCVVLVAAASQERARHG